MPLSTLIIADFNYPLIDHITLSPQLEWKYTETENIVFQPVTISSLLTD